VLGVLNHEIASFIAAWMVADALWRWWLGRASGAKLAWTQAIVGGALFVTSLVGVELLRSALLVEEIGHKIFTDAPPDMGSSLFIAFGLNLQDLGIVVSRWDYSLALVVPLLAIATACAGVWLAVREPRRFGGLAITYAVMIVSLAVFGKLFETRIFVPLLALAVVTVCSAQRDDVR
jgi:hypothetical protein